MCVVCFFLLKIYKQQNKIGFGDSSCQWPETTQKSIKKQSNKDTEQLILEGVSKPGRDGGIKRTAIRGGMSQAEQDYTESSHRQSCSRMRQPRLVYPLRAAARLSGPHQNLHLASSVRWRQLFSRGRHQYPNTSHSGIFTARPLIERWHRASPCCRRSFRGVARLQ